MASLTTAVQAGGPFALGSTFGFASIGTLDGKVPGEKVLLPRQKGYVRKRGRHQVESLTP